MIWLLIKTMNVRTATIQRSHDVIYWEDWTTIDMQNNTGEAVDLITEESKCFCRAVDAATTTME